MTDAVAGLGDKIRRALRDNTGTSLNLEELRIMADIGVLELLLYAEAEEVKAGWTPRYWSYFARPSPQAAAPDPFVPAAPTAEPAAALMGRPGRNWNKAMLKE